MQPIIHRSENTPDWALVLQGTAAAGILGVFLILLGVFLSDLFAPPAAWAAWGVWRLVWFAGILVLWRQLSLRKWACVTAATAAWWMVGIFLAHSVPVGFTVIAAGVAVMITAACNAGWSNLRTGF